MITVRHLLNAAAMTLALAAAAQAADDLPATPASRPDPMRDMNRVVGVVNGRPITLYEIDERVRPQLAELRGQYEGLALAAERMALRKQTLRERIDELLLLEEARNALAAARINQIDLSVDAAIKTMIREAGSLVLFQQQLKDEGRTVDTLRREKRESEVIREFVTDRINRRIVVTPRDIKEYYDRNIDRFSYPRQVRARVILISAQSFPGEMGLREARDCVERLRSGSDFGKLAARYPDSPRSADGGDFGFVAAPFFIDAVDEVLFSLEPHVVPDPIRTPLGYYVVRVDAQRPARVAPLDDVQEEIVTELHERQRESLLKEFLEELYGQAVIRTVW